MYTIYIQICDCAFSFVLSQGMLRLFGKHDFNFPWKTDDLILLNPFPGPAFLHKGLARRVMEIETISLANLL